MNFIKITIDKRPKLFYNIPTLYFKPLSRSSKYEVTHKRAVGWCDDGCRACIEWTCKGGRKSLWRK